MFLDSPKSFRSKYWIRVPTNVAFDLSQGRDSGEYIVVSHEISHEPENGEGKSTNTYIKHKNKNLYGSSWTSDFYASDGVYLTEYGFAFDETRKKKCNDYDEDGFALIRRFYPCKDALEYFKHRVA